MNYSIIYSSKSGNTKQLAETIYDFLTEKNLCVTGFTNIDNKECNITNASCIFVGFWTDKGNCEERLQTFLQTLENKTIFLFGTAGFGGSQSYFEKILSNVKQSIPSSNTIIGSFMCQGKMPIAVKNRYEKMKAENPNDTKFDAMIENFDKASSHPDIEDLQCLKNKILSIL